MYGNIFEIKGITKIFSRSKVAGDSAPVLDELTTNIPENEITSLIGSNGAGKSTLLNILNGFTKVDTGEIIYKGKSLKNKKVHEIANLGIGRLFQNASICPNLSVSENMLVSDEDTTGENPFASIFQRKKIKKADEAKREKARNILRYLFGEDTDLLDYFDEQAHELSFGQKKQLALACLLMKDYDILLLDEPTAGIDADIKEKLPKILRKKLVDERKKTIFLIEHDFNFIEKVEGNCIRIAEGKITHKGEAKDVIKAIAEERGTSLYKREKKETTATQNTLLKFERLNTAYLSKKKDLIIKDLNFDIKEGEILAIIGKNGAGKSTIVRTILNSDSLVAKGKIIYNDNNLLTLPTYKIAKKDIGFFMQGGRVFPSLTVEQNLIFVGEQIGLTPKEIEERKEEVTKYFDLFEKKQTFRKKADGLSGGQRHQLAMAMVFLKRPKMLILDEPSAGLESKTAEYMYKKVIDYQEKRNTTVLLIEHSLERVYNYSTSVAVLQNSKMPSGNIAKIDSFNSYTDFKAFAKERMFNYF